MNLNACWKWRWKNNQLKLIRNVITVCGERFTLSYQPSILMAGSRTSTAVAYRAWASAAIASEHWTIRYEGSYFLHITVGKRRGCKSSGYKCTSQITTGKSCRKAIVWDSLARWPGENDPHLGAVRENNCLAIPTVSINPNLGRGVYKLIKQKQCDIVAF